MLSNGWPAARHAVTCPSSSAISAPMHRSELTIDLGRDPPQRATLRRALDGSELWAS